MFVAGRFLELLFEDRFKIMNSVIRKELNKELTKFKGKFVHEIT